LRTRLTRLAALAALAALATTPTACGPVDRGARYAGPVPPCEVTQGGADAPLELDADGVAHARLGRFFEPGPYATWNTSPAEACADDPVTESALAPGKALYVTYPARRSPTHAGEAVAADGPFPLVVFSHANNDTTCSIFQRYHGLHDHWASWGVVVFSVDDTDLNCQRGTRQNIVDRRDAMLAALEDAARLNADPASELFGRLDLDRVVFAGHSRGGGAAMTGALARPDAVDGVIALQSVDLTGYGFGSPRLTFPTLGVSASEDKDLEYPYVEVTEELLDGPYTWVTIHGGVHAYTSTEVSKEPDEVPGITRGQQLNVTEHYTTAFLADVVGVADGSGAAPYAPRRQPDVLASHAGAADMSRRVAEGVVSARWRGRDEADALVVDRFDEVGPGEVSMLGLPYVVTGDLRTENTFTYDREQGAYAKARGRLLDARAGGGALTAPLPAPIPAAGASLRARVKRAEGAPATRGALVLLSTPGGRTIQVPLAQVIGPRPLTDRYVQVDVDLGAWAAGEEVVSVGFALGGGALVLDDLRVVR
jgi:pimeloyl-ACP methyl ester carboxylesterase